MKFTHEYINSFGVVVAIMVALSSVVERSSAIPIIGVMTVGPSKPPIVERAGTQLYLTTNHAGSFRILNTNQQKAHISLRFLAIDNCRSAYLMNSFYSLEVMAETFNQVVIVPNHTDGYGKISEVLPGQLLDLSWDVNVQRPPDKSGEICAIVSTLLADGSQFSSSLRVGFFSNYFNEQNFNIFAYSAREALADAIFVEGGKPMDLTEDEVDYLLKTGDNHRRGPLLLFGNHIAVPERTCFRFFAWRWCSIGRYSN